MQKRLVSIFIVLVLIFVCICIPSYAADDISLVINNKKVQCDVPPVAANGRTLVPVRVLFEHLDAKVKWIGELNQVIITIDDKIMIFNIDSRIVYINGEVYTLDAAPVVIKERTLVPIRFISENLNYDIQWDGDSRTVYVNTEVENPSVDLDNPATDTDIQDNRPKISLIDVYENDETYKITINIEKNITPKVMELSDPHRLIFDFYGAVQTCRDGKIESDKGSVTQTRWASHDEFVRVVVESRQKCTYKLGYTVGRYEINILNESSSADTEDITPTPPQIIPEGAPLIVLDSGHGGYDPGAVGRDDNGNIILYEKEVSLKIAKKVQSLLAAKGISVIMTRSTDVALGDTELSDLLARAKIANDADADLFVSIHQNAYTSPSPNGTCVLYSGVGTNTDYGIGGMEVAQNIQDYMVADVGLADRGIVARPNIVVLRETKMPAVLIECAFITNPSDQMVLLNESKLNTIANAIYKGIVDSLKTMGKIRA